MSLYSDDHCKTNKTTAPVNKCMVLEHIGSFGIGCPSPTSARLVNPTKLQSTSQPSPTTSFKPVSQPSSQPASQPSSQSTSLPASQPSLTSGSGGGNSNNGGLSTSGTIAIGVVLPAVSVIVAIIFGVRMWNSGFPHRKGRDLSEVPMGNLGGNGLEPLKDSEQPFNEGPKVLLTDPPVFGEPWKSPTTTAYSQVSVNTVPVYSPISGGYTDMYPHNAEALSPMSSMQTQSPWNLSRAQTPYYDTTTVNNSQAQYPQVGGVTELSARSRQQPSEPHTYYKGDQLPVDSQGFAELPTESRHTARQMPELSSHNDGYTRK